MSVSLGTFAHTKFTRVQLMGSNQVFHSTFKRRSLYVCEITGFFQNVVVEGSPFEHRNSCLAFSERLGYENEKFRFSADSILVCVNMPNFSPMVPCAFLASVCIIFSEHCTLNLCGYLFLRETYPLEALSQRANLSA